MIHSLKPRSKRPIENKHPMGKFFYEVSKSFKITSDGVRLSVKFHFLQAARFSEDLTNILRKQ